jgi:hypothetical protein
VGDEGGGHIAVVIVIADDCVNTQWRTQASQRFRAWNHVGPVPPRHVISAQHDDVRALSHHQRSRAHHVVSRHHLAVMKVRDEADPQTVE